MATTPDGISRNDFIRCVDWVICERRTRKVLDGPGRGEGNEDLGGTPGDFDAVLREVVTVAGWAPFHYPRQEDVPEPWRFYVLNRQALDALLPKIQDLMIGKLPVIFAGAGALIQVTWLPETDPQRTPMNWEHAAAAAAAVQNLVLAAEARGMGAYWSSAKPLASESMFRACGIPATESYLGSVFLGKPLPPEREAVDGFSGKMRPRRTAPERGWATWVEPSE